MNLSFQKIFYTIATVFAFFTILILAKSILIPIGFALLISFILFPVVKKFEKWGMNTTIASFLSILLVISIIGGGIFLFSKQIFEVSKKFSHFQDKLIFTLAELTLYINKNLTFLPNLETNELSDRIKVWLSESTGSLVKQTFSNTASFLAGFLATIIFTFLFLIYKKGLVKALSDFSPINKRERVIKMFKSVQHVGQQYLFGMIIIVIVIGFANSIGLMLIGIDNPFLFGFLGSFLAIIPYIGTVSGAILPFMYALIYHNSLGMALAVAILYWFVQLISDNFLSPKIVGGNMNINAITAILSLIIGAVVWGIAGMILFLPFAAMFKIVCEEYEDLKPVAVLIGNQNYQVKDEGNTYQKKWVIRIKTWFANFSN